MNGTSPEVHPHLRAEELSSTGKFDPRLSSLRGLCSLWVLLLHEYLMLPASQSVFFQFFVSGWVAVPVFFLLSIYLLLKSLDAGGTIQDYFLRRVRRIWPLYFFTVALVYLAFYHDTGDFLWNASFLADFVPWVQHQYVFWSLQIEEFAYLFFPTIHRMSREGKLQLAWVLIGVSTVYLMVLEGLHVDASTFSYLYHLPPLWLAAYGFGILAYLGEIPDLGKMAMPLAAMAVAMTYFADSYLWAILLMPFVALLLVRPPEFLRFPVLVFFGEISYGLYLIHSLAITVFGLWSIPISILAATAMELPLRYDQILRRLRLAVTDYEHRRTRGRLPGDVPGG